ncbi:hypothetical protein [Streptomyces sp. NPDC057052]|uniref:hypothetical protein n=1 Tax=Streptomyces sp. NPDC057052 TaxID=3346010 RepID=UPI003629C4C5
MILDAMTKADAERLPSLEGQSNPEIGSLHRWEDFSDGDHSFFVRPVAVNVRGCMAEVFGIRDGIVKPLGFEEFIRDGGRLRVLDE